MDAVFVVRGGSDGGRGAADRLLCAAIAPGHGGDALLSVLQMPVSGDGAAGGTGRFGWRTLLLTARPWAPDGPAAVDWQQPPASRDGWELVGRVELIAPSQQTAGTPAAGGVAPSAGAPSGLLEGALLAWHPEGTCLAVAVSGGHTGQGCWLLLLTPDLQVLHECCWASAVSPPAGTPGPRRRAITSLAWLADGGATLAAVDTAGQLALLRYSHSHSHGSGDGDGGSGGAQQESLSSPALERLQVLDSVGLADRPRIGLRFCKAPLAAWAVWPYGRYRPASLPCVRICSTQQAFANALIIKSC